MSVITMSHSAKCTKQHTAEAQPKEKEQERYTMKKTYIYKTAFVMKHG